MCPLFRSMVSRESEGTDVSFTCCHDNTKSNNYSTSQEGDGMERRGERWDRERGKRKTVERRLTENPSSHLRSALPLIFLVRWMTIPRSNFCLRWYAGRLESEWGGVEKHTVSQSYEHWNMTVKKKHISLTCSDVL